MSPQALDQSKGELEKRASNWSLDLSKSSKVRRLHALQMHHIKNNGANFMLDSLCVEQLMNLIQFLNIIWFSNCKAIRNASRLKNYHHTFRVVGNQTQMTKLNKCNQFNPLFTFLFLLADLHNLMNFSEVQDQIFAITTITRIRHCKIYAKYGTKELHEKKKYSNTQIWDLNLIQILHII